jgi:ABC-type Fe3+/spermidine/putrescine transport system ATPase subunit
MTITVQNLTKSYTPDTRVVDDVSFEIQPGEMFFLLGPSGCGKTTVLRMLAGFITPDGGDLLFDGKWMNDVPPQDRHTAMVFQSYAIWPHLTLYENVAYGLRVQKMSGTALDTRVRESLRLVRLEDLAQRKPAQLSGGQQQRVALARALAVKPGLILLDEPLSNLDAQLRLELRDELRRVHAETQVTCLYVTHDQEEALSLADRLAVMNRGRIEQVGTPAELFERPVNPFVAQFMGEINVLAPGSPLAAHLGAPTDRSTGFRPARAVAPAADGFEATVERSIYLGNRVELMVKTPDGEALKLWSRASLAPGSKIKFQLAKEDLLPL